MVNEPIDDKWGGQWTQDKIEIFIICIYLEWNEKGGVTLLKYNNIRYSTHWSAAIDLTPFFII